ncbi:MAG: M1 family metallopeptidase [Rubricoccaceae bacterium]
MPRLLAALTLILLTPLASAQSPVGSWTYELGAPGQAEGVFSAFETGMMTVPEEGAEGRIILAGNRIDSPLSNVSITREGEAFTVTGTMMSLGAPFTFEGTLDGENAEGTFAIGGQAFPIRATRGEGDIFAAYEAEQDSLRTANAPEPVDLFEPYAMPTPNTIRTGSGRPGPDYWQQRADYDLTASLDDQTHTVTGEVRLTYTNNSPETLTYLWFHLEQNLFETDSRGGPVTGRATSSLADEHGYRLGDITVDGQTVEPMVTDTRMRLDLPEALRAGGGTVEVVIPYSFVIPASPGTPRMGRLDTEHGTVYSMAQWFPRVAVFDDVNGWNHQPYLGSGEFYLNYGDYTMELTVPASHTIVATGTLLNEDEVYSHEQRDRLAAARNSTSAVLIVTEEDRDDAASASGTKTWRYRAENVRDVAWGTSKAFIVDGANAPIRQLDGDILDVLILSAYPSEGVSDDPENPGWEEATRYGRASILNNSTWYPYPYPVAISVASHIGGMEYPMIHFSSVRSRHFGLFGVIDHELGHNWFPMIVGSDERRHAWMDEGFNTFINAPSNIKFYDEGDDPTLPGYGQGASTRASRVGPDAVAASMASTEISVDDEIMTYADHLSGNEGGWNSYSKPGAGLNLLRTAVLGQERFDAAFKEYIRRWAYKHPQPADFFRTMEDASGEDLDWFWHGWFDTRHVYDAELVSVRQNDDRVLLTVGQVRGLVFPTEIEVTFADGSTGRVGVPVEGFARDDEVTVLLGAEGRTVASATLDPDGLLPDMDRENDTATPDAE